MLGSDAAPAASGAGSTGSPRVAAVVLNTNRRDDTLECLASLESGRRRPDVTFVLDNASTDGSVEAILERFSETRVVRLETNLGYAGNNNVGIRLAFEDGADLVLVLNEDTVLDRACLAHLVEAACAAPDVGVVGPLVLHHDEPHIVQSAGGYRDRVWRFGHLHQNLPVSGAPRRPYDVDWVSGCALLVSRHAIARVGPIDARFFYYWEEVEWCLRIRQAGWRLMVVPAARLWHKGVRREYRPSPSVSYYDSRNRLLLMQLHDAPLEAWMVCAWQMARTLGTLSLRPGGQTGRAHRRAKWRGIVDFVRQHWGQGPRFPESPPPKAG